MPTQSSISQHRFSLHALCIWGHAGLVILFFVLMANIPYRYAVTGQKALSLFSTLCLLAAYMLVILWGISYRASDYGYGVTNNELDLVRLIASLVIIPGIAMLPFRLHLTVRAKVGTRKQVTQPSKI